MNSPYISRVSRRTTLKWLAEASLASVLSPYASATGTVAVRYEPTPQGYGTDPDLLNPSVPWPLVMEHHQLQQAALLADIILPGSTAASRPSRLGVPDFVNEWVSAPYPVQVADRKIILDGLQWLDAESRSRWQRGFLEIDDNSRQGIADDIARPEASHALAAQNIFFRRFRFLTVGAYYTTPEGFVEIGYTGNVPLPSYPPITEAERAILDKALAQLGLD
jgi:hypothetical protein